MTLEAIARQPLVVLAIALLAAMLAELALPLGGAPAPARHRLVGNFALGAINQAIPYALLLIGLAGVAEWAEARGVGLFRAIGLGPDAAVVFGVALLDAAAYLRHRLHHAWPWLWRLHRVHHSDPEVDASTSLRNHPLELLVAAGYGAAVTLIFGIPAAALLLYGLIAEIFNVAGHARVSLPRWIDAPARLLFVTPVMHRLHHSSDRPETDSNFAAVLSVWDRMFGSYRRGAPRQLGLADYRGEADSRILNLLANPFAAARPDTERLSLPGR